MSGVSFDDVDVSAHDVLRSQDCVAYGCPNDAVEGGLCGEHRHLKQREPGYRDILAGQAVRLRAQGLLQHEIALRLGISRSYASALYRDPSREQERRRKNGYRQPCPRCGTLMDGSSLPTPSLCTRCECAERHDNRLWPPDEIIRAIQHFNEIVGRPPLSQEWLTAEQRSELPPPTRFHRWPYTSEVQREMGSWSNAIEQAGFPRPLVGRKVRPRTSNGRRSNVPTRNNYIVLEQTTGGLREIGRASATSPQMAIEQMLDKSNGGDLYAMSVRLLGHPFRVEQRMVLVRAPGK